MNRLTIKEIVRPVFYTALFCVLAYMHLSMSGYAFDDAYIHFRIAENFLEYGRPYFNPGEPVMGSSSSGWTMLLYLMFMLFGPGVKAVSVYNSAVTTLGVFVFAAVVRETTGRRTITTDVMVSLIVLPVLVYASIGLMETPTAMLMLGLGALLFYRGSGLAFLFLAAGVFFRPELVVFLALCAILNLHVRNVPAWKTALFAAAGSAPFVIYNHYFFGTDIPHTIRAKSLVFAIGLMDTLNTGFPAWPLAGAVGHKLEFVLVVALIGLTLTAALRNSRMPGEATVLLLAGGGAAVVLAYMAKGVYILEWYVPIYFVPLLAASLVRVLTLRKRVSVASAVLLMLVMVPFATDFCRAAWASASDKAGYPGIRDIARARKYLEVGGRLNDAYPGCTLMSSEIGGLGYAFRGKIQDAAGLVSEDALKYHPMKVPEQRLSGFIATVPSGYVREKTPDIIVGFSHHLYEVLSSPDILDDYVLTSEGIFALDDMHLIPAEGYMEKIKLNVLIRKDRFNKGFPGLQEQAAR